MESGLIAGGSSLFIMLGYCLFKKLRRADCMVEKCSGCLTIHIPAEVEMVHQTTTRIEKMMETLVSELGQTTTALSISPKRPANASSRNSIGTQNRIASGL